MTSGVITAGAEASALEVARLMRDHRVGSVLIVASAARPVATSRSRRR
jgi:CBS domain-containing protein